MTPEQRNFAIKIIDRAERVVPRWGEFAGKKEDFVFNVRVKGEEPVFELSLEIVLDGAEAFAEFNLRDEDAAMRDAARKIQRDQLDKIRMSHKLADRIIQYGLFGEVQL